MGRRAPATVYHADDALLRRLTIVVDWSDPAPVEDRLKNLPIVGAGLGSVWYFLVASEDVVICRAVCLLRFAIDDISGK